MSQHLHAPVEGLASSAPESAPEAAATLDVAHAIAARFIDSLGSRPAAATCGVHDLRNALSGPLPEQGTPPDLVLQTLADALEPGLLGSGTGRFFGWVIGGALPAAIGADWLASAWDQNAAAFATSPAISVVEEVCGAWLKDALGLPPAASFAFVTGCQMAHATALAAARHRLLAERGIDVEAQGLANTPPIRILTGVTRHESLLRAARLTGIGLNAIHTLPVDAQSRLQLPALERALAVSDRPTIVVLQAGDMATGAFDPFGPCCAAARRAGAWIHIDGAIGLWAAASPRLRHLMDGADQAHSWATDGHKWLNVTQDCGYVFIADTAAHFGAFAQATSFAHGVAETRRPLEWGPEWSRRARVLPSYAVLRSLGRDGLVAMIDRTCDLAAALVQGLSRLPGVEVLAWPQINQGLVRFLADDGDHDARTGQVVARVQTEGLVWFGTTQWRGMRAMRISVCDWRTGQAEIAQAVDAVAQAIMACAAG